MDICALIRLDDVILSDPKQGQGLNSGGVWRIGFHLASEVGLEGVSDVFEAGVVLEGPYGPHRDGKGLYRYKYVVPRNTAWLQLQSRIRSGLGMGGGLQAPISRACQVNLVGLDFFYHVGSLLGRVLLHIVKPAHRQRYMARRHIQSMTEETNTGRGWLG